MRLPLAAMLTACTACATAADFAPFEVTTQIDLRGVAVDSPLPSFTEGGMGLLRYDEDHEGARLGRIVMEVRGPITETVHAQLVASATVHVLAVFGVGDPHRNVRRRIAPVLQSTAS